MLKGIGVFLLLTLFVISANSVLAVDAFDVAISNSDDWRDVYSTMLFSALSNSDGEFLVSTSHGALLLNGIRKDRIVFVVSSRESMYVLNYPSMIEGRGFTLVEEMVVDSANLELIEELPNINNFVIVGDDYGYNAIAVNPYARISDSWVFLADRANIDEIDVILSNRNVDEVLIYGYVDREVRETLSKYNPKIVSTGDKFLDNVEIVKMYLEKSPTEQVVLTNGEFIEKEIMLGATPVLFTGRENVPDQIRDYIKGSELKIGVLVGNELVGAATNIKRSAGIDVIAKFARGSRSASSGVSQVEGLDLFYLPSPRLELAIYSIKYNRATSQLEVTYQSNSNVPAYFQGTIEIESEGDTTRVGDLEPIFIAPGDFKTVVYDSVSFNEKEFSANVYTLYGEVETALDRILQGTYKVDIVNVIDSCEMEIISVVYNKQKQLFYVKVKNLGLVDCYIDVEMRDVMINEVETTIGSENVELIKARKSKNVLIDQEMSEEDLSDNGLIEVYGYYGQRKESLVNVVKGNFEIIVKIFTTLTWIIIILVFLIIILIILAFFLKRRDKDF